MRIVFLGTPQFAVLPLEHLVQNGYQVVAVFTQQDKPAGRGRHLVFTPVKAAAAALELPVLQPGSLKKAEAVAELDVLKPDVIVVAAFGQILPKAVLDLPGRGSINIHPSLLPRHRGASPVPAAILAGDEFTGVSIMLMDEGLDTGPVLARAQIPISDDDNAGSLAAKLSLLSAHLLQDVLLAWGRGQLSPQPQDEAGATYSGTISKEEGQIDWHQPAVDIWRRVRAFNPWPGSYTRWQGKLLKIIEAMPLLCDVPPASEGQVIALPGGGFGVGTGSGVLAVLTVKAEGKQAVPAAAFLRGQRQLIGAKLPC
ncbi:MAG: methionyl-tRNA formyltransferase [Dehalococcoidales bacterium]|nr:methionyl-tRNA formyltransferase [Dehalococcoidales bacterium]